MIRHQREGAIAMIPIGFRRPVDPRRWLWAVIVVLAVVLLVWLFFDVIEQAWQ